MESEDGASNLGEPLELKAEVASFLEESSETSDGKSKEMSPELAVPKFANWVRWKMGKCDTLAGGQNYRQSWGRMTLEDWPEK